MSLVGSSARMVAAAAAAGTLPMAAPPSLTKSLALRSAGLPQPITTRRATLRLPGATRSRVLPLRPLKLSAAAARATSAAAAPSRRRVAGPSFSESSQNTTRTPVDGIANSENPMVGPSAMTLSSCGSRGGKRGFSRRLLWPGPDPPPSPAGERGIDATSLGKVVSFLPFRVATQRVCLASATLSGELGTWGMAVPYGGAVRGPVGSAVQAGAAAGEVSRHGVDRLVHLPHHAGRVPFDSAQPDRGDLARHRAARHRPDDQPGPNHPGLPRHHLPRDPPAHARDRAGR